jgi:hypothetical protein
LPDCFIDHFDEMKGLFLLANGLIEYQIGPDPKASPVPKHKPKLDAHLAYECGRQLERLLMFTATANAKDEKAHQPCTTGIQKESHRTTA